MFAVPPRQRKKARGIRRMPLAFLPNRIISDVKIQEKLVRMRAEPYRVDFG